MSDNAYREGFLLTFAKHAARRNPEEEASPKKPGKVSKTVAALAKVLSGGKDSSISERSQ